MEKRRVLIVDDEPHIIRSLGFVLSKGGYEVAEARSGRQALESVRDIRPDLVFLDVMLPELDGYEVCRRIKGSVDTARTYVVMLTAKGLDDDRTRGVEAGADEYMTKPFSPSRALEKVNEILGASDDND